VQAIVPISLKRIAVARMRDVEKGNLNRDQAELSIKRICKISRVEITAYLTRNYDRKAAEVFHFSGCYSLSCLALWV
jgi:hypothetical protein